MLGSNGAALGMSEGSAFADINNLEHCVKYLNQTFITSGVPALLDLFSNDPRHRDIEFRQSNNEQRQCIIYLIESAILLSDISRLEARVERLEGKIASKDRDIATMTGTEAKATAAFKAQIEKLQQEKDEFQKMVLGNQQMRTQQIHTMKKKEKEYMKLQEAQWPSECGRE